MLNTILIGFGNIAAGYSNDNTMNKYFKYATHVQVLKDHPDFILNVVVDKDKNALLEAKNKWNIGEVFENINELENHSDFDVAVLAIPPEGRLNIIKRFPNLKAIILEKPVAENINEAKRIKEYCENKGILVQVNFTRRFDKKITNHFNNIHKDIGKIQSAFGLYGNGLNNNGSHLIDWSRMFLGEVNWVRSIANGNFLKEGPINNDSNFPFILGFDSQLILMVHTLEFKKYREILLDFWGEKGRLFFSQEGLISSLSYKKNHRFLHNDFELENDKQVFNLMGQSEALYNLYSNLSEAVLRNSKLKSDLNNAFTVMKIIKKIEKSFEENDRKILINE